MFSPSPLPRTFEASVRDLRSERAATRVSAVRDLVRHAGRDALARSTAIPLLERALRDDEVPDVRAAAAVGLSDVRAQPALATLLFAVEDADAHVRQMALAALGEIGDRRAAPRLDRALRDPRPEIRYQAVIAYARVLKDDPVSVAAALATALEDGDAAIRYIAMRVAEEFGVDGEPLRDPRLAAHAAELLHDGEDAVAVVAALHLARLDHPEARLIVLDVIAERRSTPEIEDERACVELAGELKWHDAVSHLERRAWGRRRTLRSVFAWGAGDDASCAWHARIALARLGHEKARAEILTDLRAWRRETREAAVVAAGRAQLREARAALESLGETVDPGLVREALVRLALE